MPAEGTVPEPVVRYLPDSLLQSPRFSYSLSQILTSTLKIRKNRFRTIVPSYHLENRFCTPKYSLLIYIYYYIYFNIYNNIYKYNTPFLPNNHKTADGTMVRWYFSVFSGYDTAFSALKFGGVKNMCYLCSHNWLIWIYV